VMQGVLMLAMGVLAYLDALSVPGVLVVAFLAAMGSVFYGPAVSTLLLDIIPHDDMVRGQSIASGVSTLINLVGTAFSGAMVALLGVPLIVVINGCSNLYSAVSELFVKVPKTVQQGEKITVKGILGDFGIAIKTVFSDGCLRIFIPGALILNLLSAGPMTLMLPFALEKGFTVDMYGYGSAVVAAASLLGVVLLSIVKLSPKARFWVMALGFSVSEPLLIIAYFSNQFVPLCVFLFLSMVANTAGNAVFNASLMLALPEENRGAILGFIQAASTGGMALSAVIYGMLGDVFPLYLVFAAGSALTLVPMLCLCFHPRVKEFILNH